MNFRATLALVVVLAVLGGYIYFFQLQKPDSNPVDPDLPAPVYGVEYGEYDVVALAVTGPGGAAHFARTAESVEQPWRMLQPTVVPADRLDQARVNGAATRLAGLTASQVITGVTNLAQYGLESPELTITLTISDGQKIVLYSGAASPVGGSRYVRTETDARTVFLVSGFAIDDLRSMTETPPYQPTPVSQKPDF